MNPSAMLISLGRKAAASTTHSTLRCCARSSNRNPPGIPGPSVSRAAFFCEISALKQLSQPARRATANRNPSRSLSAIFNRAELCPAMPDWRGRCASFREQRRPRRKTKQISTTIRRDQRFPLTLRLISYIMLTTKSGSPLRLWIACAILAQLL